MLFYETAPIALEPSHTAGQKKRLSASPLSEAITLIACLPLLLSPFRRDRGGLLLTCPKRGIRRVLIFNFCAQRCNGENALFDPESGLEEKVKGKWESNFFDCKM